MPRVLLLFSTASYRAGAFLQAAAKLGVTAVVGTDREQALASRNPSGHLTLDFHDPAGARRRAAEAHAREPLAAVLAADDDGVVLAAEIAAALGLRHSPPEAVRRARDKRLMRRALREARLPTPWFDAFAADREPREIAALVPYPCVLKPAGLSGSQGVLRANDAAELLPAFRRVAEIVRATSARSEAPEVLIEGYIPGVELAVEGLLDNGQLRVLAVFDKPDPLQGPTFEETMYVTPSRLPERSLRAVERCAQAMAVGLGLTHGPVHAELRLHADEAWPVEIAPRSIGGLCSRAVRAGTGASLEELILRHALGEDTRDWVREGVASGVMMVPIPRSGRLREVGGIERARRVPGIEDARITVSPGQRVTPLPEGDRYLGFLFARAERPEDVEQALRRAHGALEIHIVETAEQT